MKPAPKVSLVEDSLTDLKGSCKFLLYENHPFFIL